MRETKTCYVVEATYVEDAARLREPHRAEHLERLAKLHSEGVLLLGAAFSDTSGSLLVLQVANEESVAAIVETDVYWQAGVWTEWKTRAINRVCF